MASGESGRRQSVYKIFGEPPRPVHAASGLLAARICCLSLLRLLRLHYRLLLRRQKSKKHAADFLIGQPWQRAHDFAGLPDREPLFSETFRRGDSEAMAMATATTRSKRGYSIQKMKSRTGRARMEMGVSSHFRQTLPPGIWSLEIAGYHGRRKKKKKKKKQTKAGRQEDKKTT
ncbi:hypothetical protein A7C99_7102 [Trichophyton rubrum]|uniref:Uncharacterized protein n=1 Tax=Trichophyton rubrum TaxID=5551 RepID=A0A178ERS7_TRIRU|nr:hypothetical protein A7C99_7102 [Trichophyton rubrum]